MLILNCPARDINTPILLDAARKLSARYWFTEYIELTSLLLNIEEFRHFTLLALRPHTPSFIYCQKYGNLNNRGNNLFIN